MTDATLIAEMLFAENEQLKEEKAYYLRLCIAAAEYIDLLEGCQDGYYRADRSDEAHLFYDLLEKRMTKTPVEAQESK